MQHERGDGLTADKFYKRGRRYQKQQQSLERRWRRARRRNASGIEEALDEDDDVGLLRGKIKREELKEVLFEYMSVN